jgi:hypothetical protein
MGCIVALVLVGSVASNWTGPGFSSFSGFLRRSLCDFLSSPGGAHVYMGRLFIILM